MKYLLMVGSILLSVVNACLLKGYTKGRKENYSNFLFNGGVSATWIGIMLVLFLLSHNTVSALALLFGGIYGVILFAFLYFKTSTMQTGPIALGTLIGSCAFLITTVYGVFCCHESIGVAQIFGIVLLLVSLVLCVNPNKSKERLTGKWMLFSLGFFLAGGAVGILYKVFGGSAAKNDVEVMLLTAAVVSLILFVGVGVITAHKKGEAIRPDKRTVLFMVLSGIASCAYIRLNISLSAVIPSVVFFPVSNGGMVILSALCGKWIFKEKLNGKQVFGVVLGCVAVVVIGCGQQLLARLW